MTAKKPTKKTPQKRTTPRGSWVKCTACDGTGRVGWTCKVCRGDGGAYV